MKLQEIQRRMVEALGVPLRSDGRIAAKAERGTSMMAEAALFLKPNDRMTSMERLEIYSRSYWYRLLDSLADDFPGLEAIAGRDNFARLATEYLRQCPSRSFTLRDLGAQLIDWLRKNPKCLGANRALALDMARLEWAHIVAFDGPQDPLLDPEHLLEPGPDLRVGLQPYVTLLELHYPVDELRVALCAAEEGKDAASNAAWERRTRAVRKVGRLKQQQQIFVAVHRVDDAVYYRRLEPEEFQLLEGLRRGHAVSLAIGKAFRQTPRRTEDIPQLLEMWFGAWARFGWLTVRRRIGAR